MSARSDLEEAKARIAKARAEGATRLDLSGLRDLRELPEEIGTLTALTSLELRATQVSDITALAGLTALRRLEMETTQVRDITALEGLKALIYLDLDTTQVSDITALAGLTALIHLNLTGTHVSNIKALAGLTALSSLILRGTQVSDIAALAGLGALNSLDLSGTQVSDITVLAGLNPVDLWSRKLSDIKTLSEISGLTSLDLSRTAVADLRPLRSLQALATNPSLNGLTFTNGAAAKADPRIAEIAGIADPATRARKLFAYLEDWVPQVPEDSPLAPTYIVPDQGPITTAPDPLPGGDADQEELRQDLVRKVAVLIEMIGTSNELAILGGAARHYQAQVSKDLALIRMQLLYSAANSLRVAYEANLAATALGRFNDQLPPLAAAALTDLVETHALFFMGHPKAAEVHQQMLAGLTGVRAKNNVDLAALVVEELEGKAKVLDPEVQAAMADDLAGAKGEGKSAEIAEKRLVGSVQNLIYAVARKAWTVSKATGKKVIEHDVIAFFLNKQTVIGAFLHGALGVAESWFALLVQFLMKL